MTDFFLTPTPATVVKTIKARQNRSGNQSPEPKDEGATKHENPIFSANFYCNRLLALGCDTGASSRSGAGGNAGGGGH
jgi:hypothetical protein